MSHESAVLKYLVDSQHWQNKMFVGVVNTLSRIEQNQGGTIDPELQKAILEQSVHADALQAAVDKLNESE